MTTRQTSNNSFPRMAAALNPMHARSRSTVAHTHCPRLQIWGAKLLPQTPRRLHRNRENEPIRWPTFIAASNNHDNFRRAPIRSHAGEVVFGGSKDKLLRSHLIR